MCHVRNLQSILRQRIVHDSARVALITVDEDQEELMPAEEEAEEAEQA